MSSPATLCEYCSQIPLDPKILDEEAKRLRIRAPTWSLGAAIRIKNSPCPLCRLFISQWDPDFIAVSSTDEVELRWILGPAGRWAFTTYGARDYTWIGFSSGMETSGHPDPNSGLFLEPWTDPLVDTSRILRWISSCEELHSSECAMPTDLPFAEAFPGLRVLRVIDVEDHCVVEMTSLEKYIALSYVWGAVANFRLTKANRTALLLPRSLEKVFKMLPNTIKDAITLTRRLGCRYLWVDALCLLQNNTEDLELGVNVMDLVYERAWLTIVAACGHDADARLPGVQQGARDGSSNSFKIMPGVEMGIVTGLDGLLERSVYHSRAWTFQEQVLSRRVLYFVENKVFYRCRAAEHAEHFVDDLSQTSADWTPGASHSMSVLVNDPVIYLSTMLSLYTKRVLTNQNDTLRAMAGIIRRIAERMKCNFFQGLPTAMLDKFITFFADGTILHRRSTFPSYSWTGWRGCVDMNLQFTCENMTMTENTKMWLRDRTWIIWYKRNFSGIPQLVWDPDASLSDMEYAGYRHRRPFRDGRYVPNQLDTRQTMPTEEVSFSREVPSYPMLQFWTLSLFYRISDVDVFRGTGCLQDSNTKNCGFVFLDGFDETEFFESRDSYEIILLSETSYPRFFDSRWVQWRDLYALTAGQCRFYNIMILEWNGGIAERRGFGLLHQGAVEFSLDPGPSWKEIFLA
ncbi:related to tol protein [Fusarium fujikuroi]|uniref:Related to tol protein n=1 Tax=Gibberella fujikuroi (strain CBS 195.34 / IMI 58289 / NRRL A-6831) TaxID=1279085 RepID=S0DYE1_GIBF5|nr:related to tol protein [Fusarium fujikuroi IMI 58289]KLO93988.1 tol protein [Fusarium fujikuroi]CCT66432.1 related to tol protein [Fusarium fujikuroi IMI 58289]SCN79195.1 related to tol protein [Fusarium fujikuroi]SCN81106.1 related to tol protein [Fusarium fujikuroi]SCN84824.1 related to tol protein [Fusarium fujikuroi]